MCQRCDRLNKYGVVIAKCAMAAAASAQKATDLNAGNDAGVGAAVKQGMLVIAEMAKPETSAEDVAKYIEQLSPADRQGAREYLATMHDITEMTLGMLVRIQTDQGETLDGDGNTGDGFSLANTDAGTERDVLRGLLDTLAGRGTISPGAIPLDFIRPDGTPDYDAAVAQAEGQGNQGIIELVMPPTMSPEEQKKHVVEIAKRLAIKTGSDGVTLKTTRVDLRTGRETSEPIQHIATPNFFQHILAGRKKTDDPTIH